jgi:hypothetical protein
MAHKIQGRTTMFKSILALIPSERPVRPVVDGSVVLAMACHAHVNALASGYESTNIPIAAIAGPATAMIFQENRLRAIERGETAMSIFELGAKEGWNFLQLPHDQRNSGRSNLDRRYSRATS